MVYNLSTLDCLDEEEYMVYNNWKNCKAFEKTEKRLEFEELIMMHEGVRDVPKRRIYYNDKRKIEKTIARFEDECARMSSSFKYEEDNPKYIPFIPEIIVLDAKHEIILSQIIDDGLLVDGKKFIFYSSSANQQKKQQVCLLEEEFYNSHKSKLMCGLDIETINKNERVAGCNTGKYLAYTSLVFSKSVELSNKISIDEVVVLPGFETLVTAHVNYLDMATGEINEMKKEVPVNHMDGAGMFLPDVLPASAQIRGGWIKGCVFPFDFRKFIQVMESIGRIGTNACIKDVWGDDVRIAHIRDNVKLILNGSQLKMWKYFSSWEEYKMKFKENALEICINNMLEYPTTDDPMVHSAYQFYQTMTREKITDKKIAELCKLTIEKINDAKTNPATALEIMGVPARQDSAATDITELEPLKACISIYPQMLNDFHVRKRIESNLKSLRKKAMGGKPFIRGFYNYICPDLYAACEHWFCGESNPKGLIPGGAVYNKFYDEMDVEEVCCLRSPHLSDCEHGIRKLEKTAECKVWFQGLDTVISSHDLLSKTLQCDFDGDEMLITHDRAFIDLVDRNKLPLYYEMSKAGNEEVNNQKFKECLKRSFENANIGEISNSLTKHLNLQTEPELNFVRYMTAYNNFVIDHPKSQYLPMMPKEYVEQFERLNKEEKFPYFFKDAKGKKKKFCYEYEDDEKSIVNRINKYIAKQTSKWTESVWDEKTTDDVSNFNPQMLMAGAIKIDRSSEEYQKLYKLLAKLKQNDTDRFKKRLREKCQEKDAMFLGYDAFYHYCCSEIFNIIGIRKKALAYLLDIEYYQPAFVNTSKEILWNCFGDIIYENLYNNLGQPETYFKVKRMAYQSRGDKALERGKFVQQMKEELERDGEVSIYQNEMDLILNLDCRKNSQCDKYLLFVLLVLYKRKMKKVVNQTKVSKDEKKHIKLYNGAKNNCKKITRATLDKWIEHDVAKKGLERLVGKNIIKVVGCGDYDKVYFEPKYDVQLERAGEKPIFVVGGGNPLYYYYKKTGERKVANCEVCGRLFPVIGNTKTCNDRCAEILRLQNKNSA